MDSIDAIVLITAGAIGGITVTSSVRAWTTHVSRQILDVEVRVGKHTSLRIGRCSLEHAEQVTKFCNQVETAAANALKAAANQDLIRRVEQLEQRARW